MLPKTASLGAGTYVEYTPSKAFIAEEYASVNRVEWYAEDEDHTEHIHKLRSPCVTYSPWQIAPQVLIHR